MVKASCHFCELLTEDKNETFTQTHYNKSIKIADYLNINKHLILQFTINEAKQCKTNKIIESTWKMIDASWEFISDMLFGSQWPVVNKEPFQ